MSKKECYRTQAINVDGEFDTKAVERFMKKSSVINCGISYAVVSIIGAQNSGKSTLLNHIFQTNFSEMNFLKRCRTTEGIWIAKGVDIKPCTLVMDVEGFDGAERSSTANTSFDKHIGLFTLAISDIILVNVWGHDIGRHNGSCFSLLKTLIEVMLCVISPRKRTLLFVIRDEVKTPLHILESLLKIDINKIWNGALERSHHNDTPLDEYFTMVVTSLSNYEVKEKEFKTQVAELRGRISEYISPGGIAGAGRGSIPASGFVASAQSLWNAIRENKDLNIPAHEALVANIRCEAIAIEKFSQWGSDEKWLALEKAAEAGLVADFGKRLGSLLDAYLSEYDEQVKFYNEGVRNSMRRQLEARTLESVYPAFVNILKHLHVKALANFKRFMEESLSRGEGLANSDLIHSKSSMVEFDQGCADAKIKQAIWDSSKVREMLVADIKLHTTCFRDAKLIEFTENYKIQLRERLLGPVDCLFEFSKADTWTSIRDLLHAELDRTFSRFSNDVRGFDLNRETYSNMQVTLRNLARSMVENKASERAKDVLNHMRNRFISAFNYDNESVPRLWTRKQDIKAITKEARSASLRLLSVLVAIRFDDRADTIERTLFSCLLCGGSVDLLASNTWETVPPEYTLITPWQCLDTWRDFLTETEDIINGANIAQEAYKRSWSPRAILDMLVAELMLLLGTTLVLPAQRLWNRFMVFLIIVLFSVCLWVLVTQWEYFNSALTEFVSKFSTIMNDVMIMLKGLFDGDQVHHQPP